MTEVSKIKGHRHPRFQGVREAGARLRPSAEGLRRLRERAHHLLQLGVLPLELPKLLRLGYVHATILASPSVERLLR